MTEDPHRIEAVVFDVGGVLLDWNPEYLFRKLIEDDAERRLFLTEICSPEWNAAQDAGRSWGEATSELSRSFPEYSELIAAYDERWEETIAGPIDETVAVLNDLRTAGIPTYALTNFSAEKWEVATDRWDFLDGFEGAVVSGVEKVPKPDLRIYRILLDRYALDPNRTFYTDDMKANVEAASAVRIDAEVFVDPGTLRQQLVDRGVLPAAT
ncbi:MAG: HAD family phosphatase [Acidimicrobiia bacterium]